MENSTSVNQTNPIDNSEDESEKVSGILDSFEVTMPDQEDINEAIHSLEGFREFERDNRAESDGLTFGDY
jgi:hypothetical protein